MNIQDVVNSNDHIAASLGTRAVQLKEALEQGTITQREYVELTEDLVDVRRIEVYAKNVKHKAFLSDVFQIVTTFLSLGIK